MSGQKLDVLTVEKVLRVQGLRADSLKPHHIGKEFVGLGVLESFTVSECCIELVASGGRLSAMHGLRLAYFRDGA